MKSPKKERGRSSAVSLTTSSGRRAGEVRIVGGRWRRTPLVVTDREGLRPTPERVRETVFDWLGHLLGSYAGRRALDLFAGSGALGLEALSRGFAVLDLVERDRAQAAGIRAALERLGALEAAALHVEDAFAFLARSPLLWDVIFIDPPFALGLQDDAVARALERLAPDGILYVERSGEPFSLDAFGRRIERAIKDFWQGLELPQMELPKFELPDWKLPKMPWQKDETAPAAPQHPVV